MVGGQPPDGDDPNVGRRHSAQQEREPPSNPMDDEQRGSGGERIRPGVLRRNMSDPNGSDSDDTPRPNTPSHSSATVHTGTSPKVRFSEDVQRSPGTGKSRPVLPAESHRDASISLGMDPTANERAMRPSLHIQTGQVNPRLGSSGGQGTNRMATEIVPTQSPRRESPTTPQQQSPISPNQRHRGYSLRRVLFARGVQEQIKDRSSLLQGVDGALELQSPRENDAVTIEPAAPEGKQFDSGKMASQSEEFKPTSELPAKSYERGNTVLPHYEAWFQQKAARTRILTRGKNIYDNVRKAVLRIHELQPSKDGRHIDLDPRRKESLIDERTGRPYVSNTIRSSRYTLWTFLPRQLFAQFSKLANLSVFSFLSLKNPRHRLTFAATFFACQSCK